MSDKTVPSWDVMPKIPVSWGEVFDKLTILDIKLEKVTDIEKLERINKEKEEIIKVIGDIGKFPSELVSLIAELKCINNELWHIEDSKRNCERERSFNENFIELARKVYIKNDQRALLKNKINIVLKSAIFEVKNYKKY